MAELTGTGRLGDDLWLMAHHEQTGKPLLHSRAVGLGVAGALVAELVVAGKVIVQQVGVVVADPVAPPERVARLVLGMIDAEPDQRPVRDWLLFLAQGAAGEVAARLAQAGYLVPAPARSRWRSARWAPVDADCAFAPLARVHSVLGRPGPVTVHGTILGGLACACGLGSHLALYLPPGARARLDAAVTGLPPGLQEVINQTQAAVDAAVLAHRL